MDEIATANSQHFDELYGYDTLHRLTSFDRGYLDSNGANLTNATLGQSWSLDPTGNWDEFAQSVTGAFTQERTHNKVNELTDFVTSGWADPQYDAAGNATTIPKPKDLTASYNLFYDAWNRLVRVEDLLTNPAVNQYDGLHRRIVRDETGESGDLRHFFYSQEWQVLEEQVEVSSVLQTACQYVWGQRYIDDLVLRDDGDRVYYLHDALFSVVAVVDDEGEVLERYAYTPYGDVAYLEADFDTAGSASAIGNNYLYTGRERDIETGLQLNRKRWYHAPLGRWVSRDPIGYEDGMNLYEYVEAFPTGAVDSTGLKIAFPPPTKEECDEILAKIDRLGLDMIMEITNGQDQSIIDMAKKFQVMANAAGYRSAQLKQQPLFFQRAVEDCEESWVITSASLLVWWGVYINLTLPDWVTLGEFEGVDRGNGDVWLIMELHRLALLRKRLVVLCKGAKPAVPAPAPTLEELIEQPWTIE